MGDLTPRTPTFTFSSTTRTTLPLDVPTGTTEGDLMIAFFSIQNATDPSTQTDWTVIETLGATGLAWGVYWRWATSSEPASYNFAHASARDAGMMISIPGVDPTTPITLETGTQQGTGNRAFDAISPTGEHVVYAFLAMTEAGPDQAVVDSTNCDSIVGQESSEASGGQNAGVAILQEYLASGGSFTPTYTIATGTLTRSGTISIAVKPAAGGGGTTVEGQADSAFGFSSTAQGVPTTPGTASSAFGGTFTASGIDRALGVAVSAFGGTFVASGIDRALGAAASDFGGTFTASGVVESSGVVEGQVQSDFGGTFTATGTGKTIVLGTATSSFGGTLTAAGVDRALGLAVASFGATLTASGVRVVVGQGASAFGFEALASGVAVSIVTGTASSDFGFTSQGTGIAAEPVITWTPPTYEVQIFSPERILNFYRLTTANTIVRVNGTFQSIHTPRPELLEGLTEGQDYFRGGYVYHLPQSLVTELLNAGFPSG